MAQEIDSLVMLVRSTGGGSGNEKLTITRNQQWSVTALSDSANGNVLERYTYDHFGKRTILEPNGTTVRATSSYNMPFGYTSREHDAETGLMYFRARYYDPHTAEFTSPDPLEYVDGMSLYRGYFVIHGIDPKGSLTRTDRKQDPVQDPEQDPVWPYGLGNIDYPYNCPPKTCEPCDEKKLKSYRHWAGVWALWHFWGLPNGMEADGKFRNAFAHCYAACWIHQDIPECSHYWELSEWYTDKDNNVVPKGVQCGGPRDWYSDQDIRNNSIGRDFADAGKPCWESCLNAELFCLENYKIVKCKK